MRERAMISGTIRVTAIPDEFTALRGVVDRERKSGSARVHRAFRGSAHAGGRLETFQHTVQHRLFGIRCNFFDHNA